MKMTIRNSPTKKNASMHAWPTPHALHAACMQALSIDARRPTRHSIAAMASVGRASGSSDDDSAGSWEDSTTVRGQQAQRSHQLQQPPAQVSTVQVSDDEVEDAEIGDDVSDEDDEESGPVSYTHLTLPTKRIV